MRVVSLGATLIFVPKMGESGFLFRISSGAPKEGASIDTLPLRCGKNSSFEIDARQHTELLQLLLRNCKLPLPYLAKARDSGVLYRFLTDRTLHC